MISHICNENTLEIRIDVGKGNLLSLIHLEQLGELIAKAEADSLIHGVVITGAGHSFSTGLDLSNMSSSTEASPWSDTFHALDQLLVNLFRFPKPFIAAINGHAVGAGFLIQLCADYTIVADNQRIKMGIPELSLGLTIDSAMTHLARYAFSSGRALQYFLYSSDLFGPDKALQIGVIEEVVTNDSLLITAQDKVMRLLRGGHDAFSRTKQTLRCETIRKMEVSLAAHSEAVFDDLMPPNKPSEAT